MKKTSDEDSRGEMFDKFETTVTSADVVVLVVKELETTWLVLPGISSPDGQGNSVV